MIPQSSDLVTLAGILSLVFGEVPPLRTKRTSVAPAPAPVQDPQATPRKDLVQRATALVQSAMQAHCRTLCDEIDEEVELGAKLARNRDALAAELAQRRGALADAAQHLAALDATVAALASWNERAEATDWDATPVEGRVQPTTAVGRQVLNAVAEDAALEDTLFLLQDALESR